MTCVCGHSDDLHEFIEDSDDTGMIFGGCEACECSEFKEDIDEDELEKE